MEKKDAQKYREEMRVNHNVTQDRRDIQINKLKRPQEQYMLPKGTTQKAVKRKKMMNKRKKKIIALRISALILGTGIGLTGLLKVGDTAMAFVGSLKGEDKTTITQLQEEGVDLSKLGLERDTIEEMEIYDGYFANTDFKNLNVTDNDILKILYGIETINKNIIRDKIANIEGIDRTNIDLDTFFDEGKYYGQAIVKEGFRSREIYSGSREIPFGFGKRNELSDEISDSIVQSIQEYEDLADDLRRDKISKINAIKKLKKMYENITKLAAKQFTKDEKGNIEAIEYDENVKNIDDNVR